MTLEDFFTLAEMKDGLTAPARVNELVTIMQKEKDYVVKNVGEATRQWSTVASTIAATENKECLDLFIQLDGLWFLDRWLKDAQKFGNDSGNSFVEESITALLRALERLQKDNQRSVPSGIWMTVKNLIGHSSSAVQDKAKDLLDSWKLVQDHDEAPQDVKKVGALHDGGTDASGNSAGDNGLPECPSLDISPSGQNDNEENNVEPTRDETLPLICSDAIQQARVDKEETQTPVKTVNKETMKQGPLIPVDSSNILNDVGENLPVKEETLVYNSEGTIVTETCGSVPTMQGKPEGKVDVSQLDNFADDAKEIQEINSLEKGAMEISSISSPLEKRALSLSADVENTLESAIEPDLKEDTDAKDEEDLCSKLSPFPELRKVVSPGCNRVDDGASLNPCRSTLAFETRDQDVRCNADALQDSSGDERKWGEAENPKTSFSRIDNDGVVGGAKEHAGNESEDDSGNDSDFFKPSLDAKGCSVMSKKSDMELDYGMVDPIDIARQVAIEVEREVDCREPSCSTSEKTSGGGIRRPNSPDSTNGKENPVMEGPSKEGSTGSKLYPEVSTGREPTIHADTHGAEPESCIYDTAASQISEAAQASEANTGKGFSGFDLNEEVCSEDADCPVSTPISVVSASRAAAAAGLPNAPLQFEGTLGWKGSAVTSAFRRIPEGDKTPSLSGGVHNNSKQRLDFLDFDLNVAEGGEDNKIEDVLSGKQIPITSGLPSGEESSVEASPRRSERLQLDLNRVSDGASDVVIDWRREGRGLLNQNGRQSPSRSSSSSSMQPSLRNIDLNDQPIFLNDSSSDHPCLGKSSFHNLNAFGGVHKQVESVISILGTRVEVKRKDSVPQTLPLPNGRISEPAMDISLTRSGGILGIGSSSVPYAHSPVYGYNGGYASAPALPFSSPMYGTSGGPGPGPIPYMVDSRGVPVVPQIMGSSSVLPSPFAQPPPPFIMNMTAGTSSGSNGAGPSRHNFDLNSGGLMMEGGGSRETSTSGGLRQFFNLGQGSRSVDEHLRANAQQPPSSSSSVLGLKRQEPDNGWEPYPINFKHQQPPWK